MYLLEVLGNVVEREAELTRIDDLDLALDVRHGCIEVVSVEAGLAAEDLAEDPHRVFLFRLRFLSLCVGGRVCRRGCGFVGVGGCECEAVGAGVWVWVGTGG